MNRKFPYDGVVEDVVRKIEIKFHRYECWPRPNVLATISKV